MKTLIEIVNELRDFGFEYDAKTETYSYINGSIANYVKITIKGPITFNIYDDYNVEVFKMRFVRYKESGSISDKEVDITLNVVTAEIIKVIKTLIEEF